MKKKIFVERIPGLFASIYEKGTRLVIDSYYGPVAEEVVSHLKSGRLLDLGTGPGYLPIEIVKRSSSIEIDGVDLGRKLIKMARENARRAGVTNRVNFEFGNASRLRFEDSSYDMVISTGMLHTLKNPIRVIKECHRVLKPGGEAWIYDPAEVASRMDIRKYKASLSPWEKLMLMVFRLMTKINSPPSYKREQVIGMISATDFREYSVEKRNKVIKAKLRK